MLGFMLIGSLAALGISTVAPAPQNRSTTAPSDVRKPVTALPRAAPPCAPGLFHNIYFERGASEVAGESAQAILDEMASTARECHPRNIELDGFIDDGEEPSLDRARALSIERDLKARGVSPRRFTIKTLGKSQPATTPPNVLNRRVRIVFF